MRVEGFGIWTLRKGMFIGTGSWVFRLRDFVMFRFIVLIDVKLEGGRYVRIF